MARRVNCSNVSTSAVSRAEKVVISLVNCWRRRCTEEIRFTNTPRLFGDILVRYTKSDRLLPVLPYQDLIDDSRMYCRLVLSFGLKYFVFVVGESDCIRKLKDAVDLRLPHRIKMSEAVQIATHAGPINQAPDSCWIDNRWYENVVDWKNTKLAVERMETVRTR